MAAIGKIRKHGVFLMIIIGVPLVCNRTMTVWRNATPPRQDAAATPFYLDALNMARKSSGTNDGILESV